jgi:DNA polymerase-3 subunit gamma/tau
MSDQRYLVTARKYRPATFDELVAQGHVSETLKNAIRLDRLAHAYLFSGPRGVGKTTAARILAKAINCQTPLEERPDEAEPCCTCASCEAFEAGRSMNVFEMDAASNNKVDDIRDLRETVRIPPQGSKKKVYILDEVHMLSNAAFNALLKTLEEPPPHVLFIFATTEPHKVLPTILSRCQRFDFRRIPVPRIMGRLEMICREEDVTADEASLMLIARKGDGALRDALSAFDQAVSLCGTDLRYAELAEALRVVDVDLFFDTTRHILDRDAAGMLRLACTTADTDLIEAAEATRQRYADVAASFSESDLLRLLMIVDAAEASIKDSTQPRLKLEMALLKMASLAHAADLRDALAKLDRLEQMARNGELPAAPSSTSASSTSASSTSASSGGDGNASEPARTEPTRASTSAEPRPAYEATPEPAASTTADDAPEPELPDVAVSAPQTEAAPALQVDHPAEDDAEATEASSERETTAPTPDEDPDQATAEASDADEAPDEAPTPQADEQESAPKPTPETSEERPAPDPESAPPASYPSLFGPPALQKKKSPQNAADDGGPKAAFAGSGALKTDPQATVATVPLQALQRMEKAWPRFVSAVKSARIHVGALLQHTQPVDADAEVVVIGVPDKFHRRLLKSQHDFLLKHLRAQTADAIARLAFEIADGLSTDTTEDMAQEVDPYEYMKQKRQESPVVQALFEKFGGELVW